MKSLIFFFFLLFTCQMQAQFFIKGKVIDSETHQPLERATVTLTRDSSSTIYKYDLTDPKGCFSFSVSENNTWTVHVTYLGYQKESQPVQKGKGMTFQLKPEAISLKEVEIKGGRIYGRQDTVKYDLSRFTSGKEQNIKEALKRLPGIDVNEQSGEIRYNGKAISQFTVEGMDVSGGRYNQVTENLKADAVKDAEVIEHFQPIRSLRNKMPSDKVALNLTLKPEIRSRWLLTLQTAGGYGDQMLYNGKLNALQLAREQQGIYLYKVDQTGKDLSTELQQLISDNQNFLTPTDVPTFINQPTFSFPLEKQRLMDNITHLASVNRLYRKNEEQQSRFTFHYLYDEQHRNQGTQEIYYYPSDTIHVAQAQDYSLYTHQAQASYNYERNGTRSFFRNLLEAHGTWGHSQENLHGNRELTQNLQTNNLQLTNQLNLLTTRKQTTSGFRSFFRYTYHPTTLQFAQVNQSLGLQQAYMDNQGYCQWKKNGMIFGITGGIQGEWLLLHQTTNFSSPQFKLYATPMWMWERNTFRLTVSANAAYLRKTNPQYTDLRISPTASLYWQFSPRWELITRAQLQQKNEEATAYYPYSYWQNYRTVASFSSHVPEFQNQLYSFYLTYKRTVHEFFWSLSGSYWNQKNQQLTHSEYRDSIFFLTTWEVPNHNRSYSLTSLLSKGFYNWNLKTSLETQLIHSEGKQAGQGSIQNYCYTQLVLTPKINWTPLSWLNTSYLASLTCNRSLIGENNNLPALWNIRQQIYLEIGNSTYQIRLTGEHYYNQLDENHHQHVWLADAETSYIKNKWRFSMSLCNLFNQKEYRYTTYSAIQQYTSWIKMRPREILVSIQYQL
ncbi:carboxypeptidase-like regulatory domain-containing protein [Phocaeicola plebeius]|uniref:carboxypeptidase-like regulatory domain-containing protein n=1 Tax=Phocaeicola plebeius TaxID=310297 RepID=UPI0026ED14E9|nr:carboxypeptidase-like regulatory domain-containing protein [Phocaeicola plebeius]MCI6050151.1 carboxypeptidase-like regulatory domain-containing protein [Phocaeicola plebeius]MDD6913155.1 carboxypeptidase-like regulatory domain-containing protein [Phocaeicola plebeius]MDY5978574.1 carboxypeptidase-like regulatory domain-containing protein [Phocaeicola plebeius]